MRWISVRSARRNEVHALVEVSLVEAYLDTSMMPRETLIYSRRNAPQGPPGQAREGALWHDIRR